MKDIKSGEKRAIQIKRAELTLYRYSTIRTPTQKAEREVDVTKMEVTKEAIFHTDAETLQARNTMTELQNLSFQCANRRT